MVSCEGYYVPRGGANTQFSHGINLFRDTILFTEVIDIDGEFLSGEDSVFFLTEFFDTIWNASSLTGLIDSTYPQQPYLPINQSPILLDVPDFSASKSCSQLDFISHYNYSDYSFFQSNEGNSLPRYDGFSMKNGNGALFSSALIPAIDSASSLENTTLTIKVINELNFGIDASITCTSAGQTILNHPISLASGDSLTFDTLYSIVQLDKEISMTLENVSALGWNTPVLINNSKQLKVNLGLDTSFTKNGKIYPLNRRYEIGADTIRLPFKSMPNANLIGIDFGKISSRIHLNGLEGPFYLIREFSDAHGFFLTDSMTMVQSPVPFVNDIFLQNDTIFNRGILYAKYFIRPNAGYPIRLKPNYTIERSYGINESWTKNYFEGRPQDSLQISVSRNNELDPSTSHLVDSLQVQSTSVLTVLEGFLQGKIGFKDSSKIDFTHSSLDYVDTASWNFTSTINPASKESKRLITTLNYTDSSQLALIVKAVRGEKLVWSTDSCRIKTDQQLKLTQYSSCLVGSVNGSLGFHFNTLVEFNSDNKLDSLIYNSDSVQFRFTGYGSAVSVFQTELSIELLSLSGQSLYKDVLNYTMDSTYWESDDFYLPSENLSGEVMSLKLSGNIQGYENHLLNTEDHFYIQLNASF